MSSMWQYPHVNLFKQFGVGQWKKCSKEGDVSSHMDRDIKATVYRISGSIPSSNYIQLPKSSSQSLNLTGRYLYVLFRPQPAKYFVVHFEVVNDQGMVIRISFSNLFKEFKSTSTWLQFPYVTCTSPTDKENCHDSASKSAGLSSSRSEHKDEKPPLHVKWTLLMLDLKAILSHYLHSHYAYLKNVKICSNLLVKNVFTSDIEYSPLISDRSRTPSNEKRVSNYVQPLPREMTFLVSRGQSFAEIYNFIRFPAETAQQVQPVISHAHLKGSRPVMTNFLQEVKDGQEARVNPASSKVQFAGGEMSSRSTYSNEREAFSSQAKNERGKSKIQRSSAKEKLVERHSSGHSAKSGLTQQCVDREEASRNTGEPYEEVHVYAERGAEVAVHRQFDEGKMGNVASKRSIILKTSGPKQPVFKSLEPDPIMKLNKVIGFGGHTTSQLLFSGDSKSVVYPCHSLVVDMDIASGKQRFFMGHTDKVSCLSMNSGGSLLASGQAGSLPIVRIWGFSSTQCLALFKTHHSGLHTLNFSHSGSVLCGVGKDRHGKSQVVVWNTARVTNSGEVCVLSKAHTDASIEKMRVAAFDDSRMVSCGWDNVRFWRVRGGALRSCPVNLEEHHQLHFTDVVFQPGFHSDTDLTDRNVYACTKNGYLFEIHYKRIAVQRVWHLLPTSGGVAINSLHMHEAFCVTGSEDGMLRVWPLDFSAVFMEAEHDGSVNSVSVSEDGLRILVGTSSGNIGILDANTRRYTTLMRSHTDSILSVGVSKSLGQLITCSRDCTIRVWDLVQGTQVYDFRSPGDIPQCVSSHPTKSVFACGFKSGTVRIFHIPSTKVLVEHKPHTGSVTGLIFSPSGNNLYSSSSNGSLALYDTHDEGCRVVRVMGNTVAKGDKYGPRALSLSEDGSQLAFIGPMEFTITVLDAETMDEVLRLDITPMTPPPPSGPTSLDPAMIVSFSPQVLNQLLVITSGARLIKFSATNGQLLSEMSNIHRSECSSLAVDKSGRYLLTAGDKVVKVWDYTMGLDLNFQAFIGHSASISQVQFTPSSSHVISSGDAVFIWEFLGLLPPLHPFHPSTPPPHHKVTSFQSVSPRKRAPAPVHYEPLKMQSFTPLPQSAKLKSHVFHRESSSVSQPAVQPTSEDQQPSIDGDGISESRSESESGGEERRTDEINQSEDTDGKNRPKGAYINTLQQDHVRERSGSDGEEEREVAENDSSQSSGGEDIQVQQGDDGDVEIVLKPKTSESGHPGIAGLETPPPPYPPLSPSHKSQSEPRAQKHYRTSQPHSSLAKQIYIAPPTQAGMERKSAIGLSGHGRNNVCWLPSTGLFVYSNGCIVVIEDLSNGNQRHLNGHSEEVSTLVVQHSGSALASSSPAFTSSPCEIRIWKTSSGKCTKVLTFHSHCVGRMAFSKDDRLLLSVGTYQENSVAVWSCHDYSLLAATSLGFPIHDVAWDPHIAYEFTAVGGAGGRSGVSFWMVEESRGGKECSLKVHEPSIPADLLQTQSDSGLEFTSVSYGAHPTLFIGTNNGLITIWDTRENKCLLYWKTEPSEISTMISSESQLVTGSVGGALQLWSVDHTHSPPSVSMNRTMSVDGAVFSANFDSKMELGVIGTSSGSVWYINWSDETKVKLISGHAGDISDIAFTKNGEHFASCSLDGLLSVWSVENMEQIVAFQASRKSCTCLAFAPLLTRAIIGDNEKGQEQRSPGSDIPNVVAGYNDGTVRIFDLVNVKIVRKMQPHAATVKAVMYSFDGHVIISGCADGMVAISNPASGLVVRVISDHQLEGAPITDLHSSAKSLMLPSLGAESHLWLVASGDRRVSIWTSEWRRDSGCQLVDWLTFAGPALAPDGTKLKKAHKCQYNLLPPSLARFSPTDPDIIMYTGYGLEKCVQFYCISRKTVFRTSALTHWPNSLDISPHGHLIAFGCQERLVTLMDFEDGAFQDFTGNYDSVNVIAFFPSGNLLISACGSTMHLWNVTLQ